MSDIDKNEIFQVIDMPYIVTKYQIRFCSNSDIYRNTLTTSFTNNGQTLKSLDYHMLRFKTGRRYYCLTRCNISDKCTKSRIQEIL